MKKLMLLLLSFLIVNFANSQQVSNETVLSFLNNSDHQDGDEEYWNHFLEKPIVSTNIIKGYFDEAAHIYNVPVELLMAIGQKENNWTQFGPSIDRGWGVMHLVKNGYSTTLSEAAELIALPEDSLIENPRYNILGAAALLSSYYTEVSSRDSLINWFDACKKFTGLSFENLQHNQTLEYFQILKFGNETVTNWGETIALLPQNQLSDFVLDWKPYTTTNSVGRTSDYTPALSSFIDNCNWESGRNSTDIDTWTVHYTAGSYAGSLNWFATCPGSGPGQRGTDPNTGNLYGASSAHFVIKNSNGEISQCVLVANNAYHAGSPSSNRRSIGVEHEVLSTNLNMWNSEPMLNASATMGCYFLDAYSIPAVQAIPGIRGHGEMPGSTSPCPTTSMPWSNYMSKINTCMNVQGGLSNDVCSGATSINFGSSCSYSQGTLVGAAEEGAISDLTCAPPTGIGNIDVWFKVALPSGVTNVTFKTSNMAQTSGTGNFDLIMGVYSACNSSSLIFCDDNNGQTNGPPEETYNMSQYANQTVYIRIQEAGTAIDQGTFDICVYGTVPTPNLQITTATATPSSNLLPGDQVDLTYTVTNSGGSISTSTSVGAFLMQTCPTSYPSSGSNLDNNTLSVSEISDNTENETMAITIPNGTGAGNYYVVIVADYQQSLTESSETNNIYCIPITVTSPPCTYSLSTNSATVPASQTSYSLSLTASASNCAWAATENCPWLTITNTSGTGSATINMTFPVNTSTTTANTCTITVGGQTFNITQQPATVSCTYSLATNSATVSASQTSYSLALTTSDPSCAWTATENCPWLTITNTSGTGSATINMTFPANTSTTNANTCTITVGGQTFNITQSVANPPNCNYTVSPNSATVPAFQTSYAIPFTVTDQNCAWTATKDCQWVTITNSSGIGNGTINLTFPANTTQIANTCNITVGGQTFALTQGAQPINPNDPPVADFYADQTSYTGTCPATIHFFDNSTNTPNAWQWEFYGTGVSPSNSAIQNPTVTYSQPGQYTVKLTAINDNGQDAQVNSGYITINCITGINENAALTNILLYPNPTSGTLNVSFELMKEENVSLQVYNILGQTVYAQNTGRQSGEVTKQIALTNATPGIYLLQITVGDKVIAQRFVVE